MNYPIKRVGASNVSVDLHLKSKYSSTSLFLPQAAARSLPPSLWKLSRMFLGAQHAPPGLLTASSQEPRGEQWLQLRHGAAGDRGLHARHIRQQRQRLWVVKNVCAGNTWEFAEDCCLDMHLKERLRNRLDLLLRNLTKKDKVLSYSLFSVWSIPDQRWATISRLDLLKGTCQINLFRFIGFFNHSNTQVAQNMRHILYKFCIESLV